VAFNVERQKINFDGSRLAQHLVQRGDFDAFRSDKLGSVGIRLFFQGGHTMLCGNV